MVIFTNQATLSYNNVVTSSNITTGELVEVLSVEKTAVNAEYSPDSSIAYAISIINSGTQPFTGLSVSDDLGAYTFGTETLYPLEYVSGTLLYYVNGVLQPTPVVTEGPPLTISGINVPAGGNAILVYEAMPTQYAPQGQGDGIENTATVSGGGIANPITASETVTAATGPRLTISKSMSPSTVAENGQLTYTFVIQNSGNTSADATDNVAVTDIFAPVLEGLAVAFNGTTWSAPANYTYDEASGTFTTVPGQITVPAATYTRDAVTGAWIINPGVSTLVVSGTV